MSLFSDSIFTSLRSLVASTKAPILEASALTGTAATFDAFLCRGASSGMTPTVSSLAKFSAAVSKIVKEHGLDTDKADLEKGWQSVGLGVFKDSDSFEVPLRLPKCSDGDSDGCGEAKEHAISHAIKNGMLTTLQGVDAEGVSNMPIVVVEARSDTAIDRDLRVLDADIIGDVLSLKFLALVRDELEH